MMGDPYFPTFFNNIRERPKEKVIPIVRKYQAITIKVATLVEIPQHEPSAKAVNLNRWAISPELICRPKVLKCIGDVDTLL
jgi:hypothetical protein